MLIASSAARAQAFVAEPRCQHLVARLSICESAQLGRRTICVASQPETDNKANCFINSASFRVWFVGERERRRNLI